MPRAPKKPTMRPAEAAPVPQMTPVAEVNDTALMADADRRSERLIGVVRIVISLVLIGFLLLSIKGSVPDGNLMLERQILIASSTMLAYAVLGVAACILSSRRLHRRWHLYLFAFLDTLFVVLSLRLALTNTALSSDYLVALPSVWLIPIIIVFGAMRYSTALQAFSAATLLIGLTGTFVHYDRTVDVSAPLPQSLAGFFSAPPNSMRLIMVTLASALIVLAVARSRRLLSSALADERRATSLTRYLPPEVARIVTIAPAEDLTRGRRQEVAVMFVDIRGFTTRSERMAPEDIAAFLTRFRTILRSATKANGGVIDKFIGDGALIIFGIPRPKADDCERAVACAQAIFAGVDAWSDELEKDGAPPVQIAIGIHADEAFLGAIGDAERMEFTVLGDMVNVASRIGDLAKTVDSGFLVSGTVAQRARLGKAVTSAQGCAPVRGHTQPVDLVSVARAPRPS